MATRQPDNEPGDHGGRVPSADQELSVVLIDEITDAVGSARDRRSRAAVIAALVHEIQEAVGWLHKLQPDLEEQESLSTLAAAATLHYERMVHLPDQDDEPSGAPSRPRRARSRNHRLTKS